MKILKNILCIIVCLFGIAAVAWATIGPLIDNWRRVLLVLVTIVILYISSLGR